MGISLPSSWLPGLQAATVLLLTAGSFFDQPLSVVPAIALAALVMSQDEEGAPAEFRPLTALLVLAGLLFLADYATYAWTLALVAAAYGLVVLVGFHPWSLIRQAAGEPSAEGPPVKDGAHSGCGQASALKPFHTLPVLCCRAQGGLRALPVLTGSSTAVPVR